MRRLAALLVALGALGVAVPAAAARPTDRSAGTAFARDALVCSDDRSADFRIWWSDRPGDGDAPAGADGDCATRPAWIDVVADASAHALTTAAELGFPAPPRDGILGGDERYDIYVLDLGQRDPGLLGQTELDPSASGTSALLVDEAYVDELPPGYPTSPEDELRVTVAHELFHAIQFGMGLLDPPQWILEGTAVWFEAHAVPGVPDNHGYLKRLVGARTPLPLWVQSGCGDLCWVPGLPQDQLHVYATWLFFFAIADEHGDADLVRRLLRRVARTAGADDWGIGQLNVVTRGTLAVRMREYALALLLRQRIGPQPLGAGFADRLGRDPLVTVAKAGNGRLWPLQLRLVPVRVPAAGGVVVIRAPGARAAVREGAALVVGDSVLRQPTRVGATLRFRLPAGVRTATLVLTNARAGEPFAYGVRIARL